jgi:hypothetical protein
MQSPLSNEIKLIEDALLKRGKHTLTAPERQ